MQIDMSLRPKSNNNAETCPGIKVEKRKNCKSLEKGWLMQFHIPGTLITQLPAAEQTLGSTFKRMAEIDIFFLKKKEVGN